MSQRTDRRVEQGIVPNEPQVQRVPIEPGFFRIPADPSDTPRLLGSRCEACGEYFFPRRIVCARCLERACADVELGPRGTLYTYTFVHVPMFGARERGGSGAEKGYGVGQVDLPEGPRVQAVLSGRADELRIGMPVELELETLREEPTGEEGVVRQVVIFRFRPASDTPAMP